MVHLNKFTFSIHSAIDIQNQVNVRLNDIKKTFENFPYNPIISSVDYFEKLRLVYCHIYTYPYKWTFYYNITNNFPGGLFKSVREISLYDEHPFEHEFFLKISQAFPFLESLTLKNNEPQKHIDLTRIQPIKYPYLTEINLQEAHEDYIKQFLNNKKTCLLNNITLHINHNTFKKITNDLTKDGNDNRLKVIHLISSNADIELLKVKHYFLNAKVY